MRPVIRTTVKLLLRNKGFIFFLVVIPLLTTLILSLKVDHDVNHSTSGQQVIELDSADVRAIYKGDHTAFIIKVYDGSGSGLSDCLLDTLAGNSMFSVCRAEVSGQEGDIRELAGRDAFDDRAGIIMYLKPGFDSAVMNDSLADGIELFRVSDDSRQELFTSELTDILSRMYTAGTVCGGDTRRTVEMLGSIAEQMPKKTVTNIAGGNEAELTSEQYNNKTQIGYAFAFLTLGFIFSGVFAAHTVITEENSKVYTRIMLTGISVVKYFTAKFIVVVMMCLVQTGVLAVCLTFVKDLDIGMSFGLFLIIVFLLGLIFSSFSMLTGIVFGDIMSSNYAAFAVWSVSAMLSGLLFPIGETSKMLTTISYLMPQRWFVEACERVITGTAGAFPILSAATVSYLTVIISLGSVGLKIRKQET